MDSWLTITGDKILVHIADPIIGIKPSNIVVVACNAP